MFRVQWERDALLELAALWAKADAEIRRRVTAGAHATDAELQAEPSAVGEAREDDLRIGFAPPLGFSFSVDEQRRVVSVLHVWQIRRRR